MAASLFIVVKGAVRDFWGIFRSATIKIQYVMLQWGYFIWD